MTCRSVNAKNFKGFRSGSFLLRRWMTNRLLFKIFLWIVHWRRKLLRTRITSLEVAMAIFIVVVTLYRASWEDSCDSGLILKNITHRGPGVWISNELREILLVYCIVLLIYRPKSLNTLFQLQISLSIYQNIFLFSYSRTIQFNIGSKNLI